jgi:uncharacterized protein
LPPTIDRQRRRRIFRIAAAVLAIAILCDWMQPPRRQSSVLLYNTIVIGGYRAVLRPVGNHFIRCRFHPTCSVYSEQAMLTHGFPKGVWLTASRIFRCQSWVPYGTEDPVPKARIEDGG